MEQPPQSKRDHLRRLVTGKNDWSKPLSEAPKAKDFRGWHERGYLPHCDKPGLTQFVTFRLVMPNHVHALFTVLDTPLSKIMQNWKSISAVAANKLLNRSGDFWQEDYWDTFMRNEEQTCKAIRYIENNPVKARLCRAPEEWPFSSARFRDAQTRELKFPK